MNRAERRKAGKEKKKNAISDNDFIRNFKWIQSLPKDKIEIIKQYANQVANQENYRLVEAIERCINAAVIDVTDMEWDELHQIMDRCAELLKEDGNKIIKNKKENEGSLDKVMKKIKELAPTVEKRVKELIAEGKIQKEIVNIIYLEFPTLSKAMVINSVKKVRSELKEKEIMKEVKQEVVEIEPVQAPIEEVAPGEVKEECEFEVINQILDVKGKYGEYHIEDKKLSWLDLVLEDNNDVESWAETSREMIREEINKLVAQIQEVDNREAEIKAVMKKFI